MSFGAISDISDGGRGMPAGLKVPRHALNPPRPAYLLRRRQGRRTYGPGAVKGLDVRDGMIHDGTFGLILADDVDSQAILHPLTATFALALGTPATTGTSLTNKLIVPRNGTILKAFAVAKTGPTGADLIFDINLNGTTIWATQANRVKIVDGGTSGTQTSFDTTAVTEGDLLTIDIDQIGSTVAGQDITVQLLIKVRLG